MNINDIVQREEAFPLLSVVVNIVAWFSEVWELWRQLQYMLKTQGLKKQLIVLKREDVFFREG